ncbi:MAG: glycosyltransferase family 4 protein [Chitinophagaceae bacterium]|nr:glycosyltransferase family 4 protein [Chitinophagaceae bacterium]
MIIGIDIRDLRLAKTGQKTTLEELCRQFKQLEHTTPHTFHFFDTWIPVYTGRNKFMLMTEHIRQQLWKQVALPFKAWRKKCDIVYCNDYFAPYLHWNFTTVQLFHDAFFFEYPQYYNPIWLQLFKRIAIPAAKKSAFIITPTEYAKKTVQHFTGIPAEKIITIYHGPKTIPTTTTANIPDWLPTQQQHPYLLHVGVFEKRKNLSNLLKAFQLFQQNGNSHYKLVLVGKGNGKMHSDDTVNILQTIQDLQLQDQVIMPGYVPDDMLGVVYQHAACYVFPSYNEGFGIPILEAFQFGIPVLVANNTCLPEVGADAVLSFDPYNPQDIAQQINTLLHNPQLQQTLIQKGHQRLQDFSWEKTARKLIEVFEQTKK